MGSGGTRPALRASQGKEGVAAAGGGGGGSEGSGGHGLGVVRGDDTAATSGASAWVGVAGGSLTLQVEKAGKAGMLAGEECRGSKSNAAGAATGSERSTSVASSGMDAVGSRRSSRACGSVYGASAPATPAAAAASAAAVAVAKVPKRLANVPQEGLPAAVVDQLNYIHSKHQELAETVGSAQAMGYVQGLQEDEQQELLMDLLQLGQVLLVEVPCTLGCSNPACVNVSGESEVSTSNKACTGCKVVYYCSRECQVAHWKVHRTLCKQLQGQSEEDQKMQGRQK